MVIIARVPLTLKRFTEKGKPDFVDPRLQNGGLVLRVHSHPYTGTCSVFPDKKEPSDRPPAYVPSEPTAPVDDSTAEEAEAKMAEVKAAMFADPPKRPPAQMEPVGAPKKPVFHFSR